MNSSASAVAANIASFVNNNHVTSALLAKLMLFDLSGVESDLADAQALASNIIQQGPPTTPPVVTGGLGRGFWPKRPLRIPLGFHMKIAPESKNKWPNTVISV